MAFADNIKFLRKRKKLTQKALAEAAGLSYNSIVNYENGRRSDPPASVVEKLARALDVLPDVLYSSRFIEMNGTLVAENSYGGVLLINDKGLDEESREDNLWAYIDQSEREMILKAIDEYLLQLNEIGREEAVKRIAELTEIRKYTEYPDDDDEEDAACPEDAPQTAAEPNPGSDLTDVGK